MSQILTAMTAPGSPRSRRHWEAVAHRCGRSDFKGLIITWMIALVYWISAGSFGPVSRLGRLEGLSVGNNLETLVLHWSCSHFAYMWQCTSSSAITPSPYALLFTRIITVHFQHPPSTPASFPVYTFRRPFGVNLARGTCPTQHALDLFRPDSCEL